MLAIASVCSIFWHSARSSGMALDGDFSRGLRLATLAWFNNSGPLVTPFWSRQAHHTSPKRKRELDFASLTLRASMA